MRLDSQQKIENANEDISLSKLYAQESNETMHSDTEKHTTAQEEATTEGFISQRSTFPSDDCNSEEDMDRKNKIKEELTD